LRAQLQIQRAEIRTRKWLIAHAGLLWFSITIESQSGTPRQMAPPSFGARHCERSEAIEIPPRRDSGLFCCARNDGVLGNAVIRRTIVCFSSQAILHAPVAGEVPGP